MSGMNKVILIGNLGFDPEIRATQDGREIANLRLATSEGWKDKTTGERKEKTEWHRVVIFNEHLVRIAKEYLKKGSKLAVIGKLRTRKWTNKEGQEQYSTEVVLENFGGELVMLGAKKEGGGDEGPQQEDYGAPSEETGRTPIREVELDDEIPF